MSGFEVTITGIADVNRLLREIAPNEAVNLMRATVHGLAKDLEKTAKQNAPVDDGLLQESIYAERQRPKAKGPSKGILSSEVKVAVQAYYWRFLEYGQGPDHVEHAFFLQSLEALRPDLDRRYLEIFVDKLIARLKRLNKKAA